MHQPSECDTAFNHCMIHGEDESAPAGREPYRVCGGCNHQFVTADDLLSDVNQILKQLYDGMPFEIKARSEPDYLPRDLITVRRRPPFAPATHAEMIQRCPLCDHPFPASSSRPNSPVSNG